MKAMQAVTMEHGQQVDLSSCADEPIHIPGSIQPHGAILFFSEDARLAGWSENAPAMLGVTPQLGLSLDALPWYQALALWKASIFCEAIYTRWLKGERPNDTLFAPSMEAGVPQLLEQARVFAGLSPAAAG